ncbi:MAG: hypothetical protein JO219_09700 [Candidatus Eremiobacteraeota bacterium]|nr:hypothetical protein [Candidatus Eremiobacteraeota bacterium]MBV8366350.1 hypothetical protein [Candidatus Eremiobacteraeota bacterium]
MGRRARFALFAVMALMFSALRPHAASAAELLSVAAQPVPGGHTRVLLQFDSPAQLRLVPNAPNNTVVLQAIGSMLGPGVANVFPLNMGNVQNVTAALVGGGLQITVTLNSPAHATVSQTASNFFVVDVPAAGQPASAPPPQVSQQPPPQVNPLQNGGVITRIYRLRYADVSEVVGLLAANASVAPSNTFNPQPNAFGTTPGVNNFGGSVQGNFGLGAFGQNSLPNAPTLNSYVNQSGQPESNQIAERVNDNIAIDRRLNAIIFTGTPPQVAQADEIVRLIDIPVESVLIDTEVLEVTDTGDKALGLDYSQTTSTPLTRIFNAQYQILNGLPAAAYPWVPALATDIFLLVSKGEAKVLASPKILTEDRLPASIVTGDSLPIRITTPVGVGGVGAVTSQVEYVNVGVNLQILPRITGEHSIETDVFSQVSSVTGFNAAGDPQVSSRQAQTRVNLLEGQTLVIGGLLQSRDIKNLQKIPIIGDIPLLGALFRFYTETRQNTNLVITITPHIVPVPQPAQPMLPAQPPGPEPHGIPTATPPPQG